MSIYSLCISHKTAPVTMRELFSFSHSEKKEFLKQAVLLEHISECVLITTCNRSEIYISGDDKALDELISFLLKKKNINYEKVIKYFLVYNNKKAVEHLFRVASGIDSMLIGEDEILGQVKDAYQLALETKTTGFFLNTIFRDAITCAKKVKTDTLVSKTSISLGTLAAHEVFHYKREGKKKVLIIGLTGKMGTILMKNLYENEDIEIMGTIRSHKNLQPYEVSYPKVKMVSYNKRFEYMNEADIVLSATSSPHYTITKDELEGHLTNQKERLFIDLAVPFDISKDVLTIEGIKLYDIDYFTELSKHNNQLKLKEVERAKLIINEQVDESVKTIYFREFVPYMTELDHMVEEKGLKKVIYELRNKMSSEELLVVLDSFIQVIKGE